MRRFVVLIGGGIPGKTISRLWRTPRPEIAEYWDLKVCSEALLAQKVEPGNIFVHWSKGPQQNTVNIGFLSRLVNKFKLKSVEKISMFPFQVKAATQQDISQTFTNLAEKIKPNDEIIIVGSGHGSFLRGMVLDNNYLTRNYLTPDFLEEEFKKFPANPIKLYMSSCFSGCYLDLSSQNVFVTTTSNYSKGSYYEPLEGCKILQETVADQLVGHINSSLKTNNLSATNSLVHYINLAYDKRLGRIYNFFSYKNIAKIMYKHHGAKIYVGGFIVFVWIDPYGIATYYLDFKVAGTIGKLSLFLIKIVLPVYMVDGIKKIAKKSSTYHNWHIRKQVSDMNKLSSPKDFDERLLPLLTEIRRLTKIADEIDPIQKNHYNILAQRFYLLGKICTEQEVQDLLAIHKNLPK